MELILGAQAQVLMSTDSNLIGLRGRIVYQSPKYPHDLTIFDGVRNFRVGKALLRLGDKVFYTRKRNIRVLRLGKHPVTVI